MELNRKNRMSAWPFLVASLAFVLATHYLFDLYGTVHWQIAGSSVRLMGHVMSLDINHEANDQQLLQIPGESKTLEEMKNEINKLSKASSSLMRRTGVYRYTGWISLGLAILAFFGKPRWAGWIALPPALHATCLSGLIM